MNTFFVLRSKETGNWIDLDSMSGGYPYEVDTLDRAHLFPNRDTAASYTLTIMSGKPENECPWTLERITFVSEPVDKQFTVEEFKIIKGWRGY